MSGLSRSFAQESARLLRDTHLPRLTRAADLLPAGDLWWRPHAGVISVGTILLHLEGNLRQWVLSGLGGAEDRRERAAEFAPAREPVVEDLLTRLQGTVEASSAVIEEMGEGKLLAGHTIQGFQTSGLDAVYHVVEHFSWHTGQAVWIAKWRAGADHGLAFYDEAKINLARND